MKIVINLVVSAAVIATIGQTYFGLTMPTPWAWFCLIALACAFFLQVRRLFFLKSSVTQQVITVLGALYSLPTALSLLLVHIVGIPQVQTEGFKLDDIILIFCGFCAAISVWFTAPKESIST